jgi:hypothetical protein
MSWSVLCRFSRLSHLVPPGLLVDHSTFSFDLAASIANRTLVRRFEYSSAQDYEMDDMSPREEADAIKQG